MGSFWRRIGREKGIGKLRIEIFDTKEVRKGSKPERMEGEERDKNNGCERWRERRGGVDARRQREKRAGGRGRQQDIRSF